ncbi:DUF6266 family protein [Myroides odoratimimus]|uniref:DUF6266 family protein n=1 Tax=Myroides odoratimimus TaxID=76832 RepID=UPI002578CD7F|nr:DUF6266 family protein [Myroides odoratimimus]MDM1499677.1 hypothetical protein [Myroides odoratimimus]
MAEIKDGILGGVHGTVGTVVGFMWRGRYFIRSKPRKSHKLATEAQVLQRSKLGVVSSFVSKFKDFVNEHYPQALLNNKMATGKEQLISMLMKEGIVKVEGEPCIDIAKVLVSMGPLPPAVIKKINQLKTGRIKVQWDNSITNVLTKDTDRLSIVAYSESLDVVTEIRAIAKREDRYIHFDLPKEWKEGKVHFWSVWKSADDKVISTSAYHGITQLGEHTEQLTEEGGQSIEVKEEVAVNEKLIAEQEKVIKSSASTKRVDVKEKELLVIEPHKEPEKVALTENRPKKKWAPPGFYGSEKSRDKEVVPLDENTGEEPRSILEAMPPSQNSD